MIELRKKLLLHWHFFLMWILIGGILAVVFSSAGPCYYGRLGLSPDPFADLMAYLRGACARYRRLEPLLALLYTMDARPHTVGYTF